MSYKGPNTGECLETRATRFSRALKRMQGIVELTGSYGVIQHAVIISRYSRLPDVRLAGLFGVFAGAAIVLALDQTFEEFGHRDVIILRHLEREDFGFRGHSKFDFLGLFSYKFWHFGLFCWSPEHHAALR